MSDWRIPLPEDAELIRHPSCAPVATRIVRDCWYQVARIRERNGDKEGAARARRNARIIGDMRVSR